MTPIHWFILAFAAFALSRAFLRYRHKDITPGQFIFWAAIWIVITAATFAPAVSSYVAQVIGVGRGADAAFVFGIVLLFYLVFRLYVKLDSIDQDVTELVRKLTRKQEK